MKVLAKISSKNTQSGSEYRIIYYLVFIRVTLDYEDFVMKLICQQVSDLVIGNVNLYYSYKKNKYGL